MRRNRVGAISLGAAVTGAVLSRLALAAGPFAGATWLDVAAAGFEAAVIGGLADWFAVTALFRHPLGLSFIPHTAIIRTRRKDIVERIVSMVQEDWLSPEVIGRELQRLSPSAQLEEWLRDPVHAERLGHLVRDFARALARLLDAPEVAEFVERAIRRQLRELPLDASAGRWLERAATSEDAAAAFDSMVRSLANIAERPRTRDQLRAWLERSARVLRAEGKRLVPLILRRRMVQRRLVEAACSYAAEELRSATLDPAHPLRALVFGAVERFAARLSAGEPAALRQVEQLRHTIVESLEAAPLVRDALARLREQLEHDLEEPGGYLATLVDRELRAGILDLLADPERRAAFDQWTRTTAEDFARRNHHRIGDTVREKLMSLDDRAFVAQIEERVGADLQFIRLNGAVVGGLIGVGLAVARWLAA